MHELSLVSSIVEAVTESMAAYPGARVVEVRLRIGALAAVEEESLQFCYGLASEGTPLAGSRLLVKRLPVVMRCGPCGGDVELPGLQSFYCPNCGAPASDLRQGRELEIEAIEIEEAEPIVELTKESA
jgi:hydrogenase nickel incorporation protein HypA/HybF